MLEKSENSKAAVKGKRRTTLSQKQTERGHPVLDSRL